MYALLSSPFNTNKNDRQLDIIKVLTTMDKIYTEGKPENTIRVERATRAETRADQGPEKGRERVQKAGASSGHGLGS